jgi:hypothetical protein
MRKFEIMKPAENSGQPYTIWKQDATGMHVFAYVEQNEWDEFKATVSSDDTPIMGDFDENGDMKMWGHH